MLPLRNAALAIQKRFGGFDSAIKKPPRHSQGDLHPPIFIIGAPRSGTTMLYQVLLQTFRSAYISNLMALLPSLMVKMTRISKRVACQYRGSHNSSFGYIPGLLSPNEAGSIMQFWFEDARSPHERDYVARTVRAISAATDAPLVLKNVNNTLRIAAIRSVLPDSRFIFIKRDPRFTAQSILLARRKFGIQAGCWSATPPGHEEIDASDPMRLVLWQVLTLEAMASRACQDMPRTTLVTTYENICQDAEAALAEIGEKFHLQQRNDRQSCSVPITPSNAIRLPADEWDRLENIYQEMVDSI